MNVSTAPLQVQQSSSHHHYPDSEGCDQWT